jgi:protein phosphatase
MLEVEFAEQTDPGIIRPNNEDCLGRFVPATPELARSHGWLFVLADGVGGQDKGEIASQLAVQTLMAGFREAPAKEAHTILLPKLVRDANNAIFQTGLAHNPAGSNMATTVVACALRFDRAIVSHVGDSRCYLVRGKLAIPLTRDHTVSSEQLRMRLISAREAAEAGTAHLLSRSLGSTLFVNVETSEHRIAPGDTLLLCSDGLHHPVSNDDIAQVIAGNANLSRAATRLVDLAKERDGSDNISVQLIRVRGVERVGMYRGRQYKIY